MSTFLVTGGAGFIGSNLVETLLRAGARVVVLDDFSSGHRENLAAAPDWAAAGGGAFALIEGDVRDPATCARAVAGVDYVLHQAAILSVVRSVAEPVATHAVNVGGTLELLEAARAAQVKRLVLASSAAVYGDSPLIPKRESMAPDPLSPYGVQKLAAELHLRLYQRLYGLPTVALRYFNVYGPRQDPASDYAAVIPRFIGAAREGRAPVVYGDGEQSRDFVFVADVVEANLAACRADGSACGAVFNIGSGTRTSLNELLQQIALIAGGMPPARHEDPRAGDIRDSQADIERAQSVLGWSPEVAFAAGLRRLWDAW